MATTPWPRLLPGMPQPLRALLADPADTLLPAIRSEIFGPQRFAQHGRSLGLTHDARRPPWGSSSFFPRLRDNVRVLRLSHQAIAAQTAVGDELSPASLWLLDNFYLIEAQLLAIHEGLPRSYFRALPVLQREPLAGLPRIYGLAWAFVAHTDSAFDEELLVGFLGAYQETRELGLAELWALPTTLRVVLVENLRRLAERLAAHRAAREVANLCCDRIEHQTPLLLAELLAPLRLRGVGDVFLAQMAQRLQDRGGSADDRVPAAVRLWLAHALPESAALHVQQEAEQTADNLSVSNAVNSLRAIGDADWPDIVARGSSLMRLMLAAPLFSAEHHGTRDVTLHAIEALALRSGRSEMQVAQALLQLTQRNGGGDDQAGVAGYWLDGPGRAELDQQLDLTPSAWQTLRGLLRPAKLALYLGTVALGSWALLGLLAHHGAAAPLPWWVALLMLVPASEIVIALLHRLISESMRPHHLPRLALTQGLEPEHRVMVVIPAMLSSSAAITALVHRLRLHHLANPEAQTQFALLTDWADASTAQQASDTPLLEQAAAQVAELNTLHTRPGDNPAVPRFVLLHRRRRYSISEQRWIGWERKRGKLEQLIAELADGPGGPGGPEDLPHVFVDLGALSTTAPGTRYVVTLDSDTQLPPGRLRELVGVAAHPANRPRLSADGRRVVGGYGILQPRLVTPLPLPREDTLFHRLFAGLSGIDPYSAASSEVYQDVFHEGSYTGKGLLDVQAMHAVLGGNLPEGQVLSHDLLEGALARCGALTDVTLIEDAPFHAEVAASRVHRWTRGDWQLLPILLRSIVQPARVPLGAVNRWKMFDNLRRSLVAPSALALLLLSLLGLGATPAATLALVLAAFAAGPLMGALAGLVPSREDVAWRHFYRLGGRDVALAAGGGLWHLAMLLQHSLLAVDAIVRALYRVVFSHRLLLQWTTAAAAQAAASGSLLGALRRHWSVPLVALVLGLALWRAGTPHPWASAALCTLWAGAPLWSWLLSRPGLSGRPLQVSAEDRVYLRGVARDTWRYFERCVTASDLHLPPDNLQTSPHDMLAHRTSPTNIGLYLLSVACARQFGWITPAQMLQRLSDTLDSVDRLQRHRGHLLNWYDTQTGLPLLPMYVSTVDSGNLSGHLLAVAQACLEIADASTEAGEATAAGLRAVAARCQRLAWLPEFGFLYHPRRHLLHIGFRVAEQELDASFYDLLASESRLTSLLAIAKGDVPVRHWSALGRPFFAVGAAAGLRSWSGSMFEYLMPMLVLAEPHGSVLREASLAALVEQMAYTRLQGVPWGISESAYAGCDHTLAYQYAPQGVPRLALRRTPPDELVIAPYASVLAAQLRPQAAAANCAALQALGARSTLGFIEALDFTPSRQTGGEAMTRVATVMAHHQGMSIVALAQVLLDGTPQRWGMADPSIEAVSSLLHERAPREVSRLVAPSAGPPLQAQRRRVPTLLREVRPGQHAVEPTHLLANGRYSVALRANGAGRSRLGHADINRSRDDALRDNLGHFLFVRRSDAAPLVSLTQHPAPDAQAEYRSVFHADRVAFEARWTDLHSRITVWVSPEDDIEFRQVELANTGTHTLQLELISAFEVSLADPRADESHPAFSNFFVQASADREHRALRFERRPRLATEKGLHAAHFLAESAPQVQGLQLQVDRLQWLGRNRDASLPRAALQDWPAAAADGAPVALDTGLDPMCALAVQLSIAPGAKLRLTLATAASDSAATLHAVIDKYHQPSHIERASLMSATLVGIRLRALRIGAETYTTLQTLSTALLLTLARPQLQAGSKAGPQVCDKRLLWRFGISGDRPLLLVFAATLPGLGLVRSLSHGLALWAWGGVAVDLVVVNAEPASYLMALQRELGALRDRHDGDAPARAGQAATGWHLLRADELSADELSTLNALARLSLLADGRSLSHHLNEWADLHEAALRTRQDSAHTVLPCTAHDLQPAAASSGAFAEDGAYGFDVSSTLRPPRPWINVLANPGFGSQLSEAGGGSSWAVNSRMNQLTPWCNDAVSDPAVEWLLLQDLRTREVWSVTPSAHGAPGVVYRVSHGPGSSKVQHEHAELAVSATWCVDPDSAVRQLQLHIENGATRSRMLRLVAVCEWMLGAQRSDRASVITRAHRQRLGGQRLLALLATQQERSGGFGGGTAFLAWSPDLHEAAHEEAEIEDWTCSRNACFDARGRAVLPDHFGLQQGSGLDPCAALATTLHLQAGASATRTLLLGWAPSADAATLLLAQAAQLQPAARLLQTRAHWDTLLGATTVYTPDPLFDVMVNRWLLYQAVACRLWAKGAHYQAGGATGFRDQLQDAMALHWAAPRLLREQLLQAAARQFSEGDVQHWWHAPLGSGVRTHFSDDLLWLPFALAHYLARCGDLAVLDETLPFIEGLVIPEGAEDIYGQPRRSAEEASLYEHAARTMDRSLRVGVHGLPLMGSGDWNDGMNRVGHGGRGESVWLAWFASCVVADFAPIARRRGDHERAQRWEDVARVWHAALQGPAWDGQWYLRAFFDDGQPLGSHLNDEARIDLIAQAWAVLSGLAPPERQQQALDAVQRQLFDAEAGIVRLLAPPLVHAQPSAGYIQAYPPGVRENGGQYAHAAVWALMAQVRHARTLADPGPALDIAWQTFKGLSPAHRAAHPTQGAVYGIEPYVVAGDIYGAAPYVGRGGWSWYTGAAAWLHRAALESFFGLQIGPDVLSLDPSLPRHWPQAEITLRREGRAMRFLLLRVKPDAAVQAAAAWARGERVHLLRRGEPLRWGEAADGIRLVVPLE